MQAALDPEDNLLLFEEKDFQLLSQLGFTETQAKLYLTLLEREEANVKILSQKANLARSEVYRIIGELQKKGLVEKEVNTPHKYIATPIHLGLEILLIQKMHEFEDLQRRTSNFLRRMENLRKPASREEECKVLMIEGKHKIIQRLNLEHDRAQQNVKILTTPQRWLQIVRFSAKNYGAALARGVEYRMILEKTKGAISLPEEALSLMAEANFEVKVALSDLETNVVVFDDKEAAINFFPGKPVAESPLIWTNHPSFISMCKDHFEKIWKQASDYKPEAH